MGETLESLEKERQELYRKLEGLGDFRRGTISVNYRHIQASASNFYIITPFSGDQKEPS
jgi:hypothetical protein